MQHQSLQKRLNLLLVEDNPCDARLIEEAFKESDLETTIHTVSDGDDALAVLKGDSSIEFDSYPDIILLDLNLPRMSGFEVLSELKDRPDLSVLPVLVLTSSEAEEDIAESYRLSANAYLTKPTGPEEFDRLVSAVEDFWFKSACLPPIPA